MTSRSKLVTEIIKWLLLEMSEGNDAKDFENNIVQF